MTDEIPIVVIKTMHRHYYFQWFLLGFYYLEQKGRIKIKFELESLFDKLSLKTNNKYILWGYGWIARKFGINNANLYKDSYLLTGYIHYKGCNKEFCIDSADAPFLFDSEQLNKTSCYFKMQCPLEITEKGFPLSNDIYIPWLDHKHIGKETTLTHVAPRAKCNNIYENKDKIKPLMIGSARLSVSNKFKDMDFGYRHFRESRIKQPDKMLMCYFENSKGPSGTYKDNPDFDWEIDIMGYFGNKISHPNEKRAKAYQIIKGLGKGYDARLINEYDPISGNKTTHQELIIPLDKWAEHISHFNYNINISGLRMSVPNRVIEAFMVGTGIITDKMAIKWYKPFDKELIETVPMGYLPMDKVNWKQFEKDIAALPPINRNEIINSFEEKWSPQKVAEYIINEVINS